MSKLEDTFAFQLRAVGIEFEREYRFHAIRKWKFDFAWPLVKVALEIHGGTFVRGAHSRGARQRKDFEKQNAAHLAGWTVYLADTTMVKDGTALKLIEQAIPRDYLASLRKAGAI